MKLEKLTDEQEALIPVIRDKWNAQLFDLKPLNLEQLTKGVEWLYSFCKLEIPKIIVCESILEAQLTLHTLNNISAENNVGDNIWVNVGANVRDNVWDNVGDNVWDNVVANVGDNVRDNVWANVWDNVWDNVGDNVWDNVVANVEIETLCSYGDINDYGWVSFFDYFTEIGVLKNDNFNSFKALISSNYYSMIQMEKLCVVIKNPKHILRNEQNQMNSTKDYAIKFNDDTGMYFINGFYLSNELFLKLTSKTYSFEDFSKESNEEVKSACIAFMQQEFGEEYLFRFLSENLTEIDTYVDKKDVKFLMGTTQGMSVGVYTLYKGLVNSIDIAYVRCYCPSTDRMFFLGVNPENTNAKDAIASLYGVPKKLKNHIVSIQRQGERFSTVFTKEGNKILSLLSQEDVKDHVEVKGDEYFSKIQYEY